MARAITKPALTPEWFGILTGIAAQRDERGPEWCEKWGVGWRRRYLEQTMPLPDNVVSIQERAEDSPGDALEIFESFCQVCRRCDLGR